MINHLGNNERTIANNIQQHLKSSKHCHEIGISRERKKDEISFQTVLNFGDTTKSLGSSEFTALQLLRSLQHFLGMEYIIEFKNDIRCYLCEGAVISKPPLVHLQSKTHVENYLSLHFPTVLSFIEEMVCKVTQSKAKFVTPSQIRKDLLIEFTMLINKHCGSLAPTYQSKNIEDANHQLNAQKVKTAKHFNEQEQNAKKVLNMLTETYFKKLLEQSVEKIFTKNSEILREDDKISSAAQIKSQDIVSISNATQQLNQTDYKVLLENFDSLESHEQLQLFTYIKSEASACLVNLRKNLSENAEKHLQEALRQP